MHKTLYRTLFLLGTLFPLFQPDLLMAQGSTGRFLLKPYLQAMTDTSAMVLVETEPNSAVTVEYGRANGQKFTGSSGETDTTTGKTIIHAVRFDGLEPGTAYVYRVFINSVQTATDSFMTAVHPGTPFRFAWMSDTRKDTTVHDSIAVRVRNAHPLFLLFGGDMARDANYGSFRDYFFRPCMMQLIGAVPFFNATGNHEKWDVNTHAFTKAPPSASGSEAYYSFDCGDLHVVVMNNELAYGVGSPQYEFIRKDLASTQKTWKILASHRPAYCAGGHGNDGDMIRLTMNLLEPNGVQMVLSGHTHLFQHNYVRGIHHLVIGSAGAPLYTPAYDWYTLRSAKEYNYAIADVSPDRLMLTVYNERGDVLDTVTLQNKVLGNRQQ